MFQIPRILTELLNLIRNGQDLFVYLSCIPWIFLALTSLFHISSANYRKNNEASAFIAPNDKVGVPELTAACKKGIGKTKAEFFFTSS